MGGSSVICPGADPDSAYIVESMSFVAWFKATLDGRDHSPRRPPNPMVHHPRSVCGRYASRSDPVRKRPFAGSCTHHVPETLNCS